MKKIASLFAFVLIFSSFLAACSGAEQPEEDQLSHEEPTEEEVEALELYTTIFPLEDFANKIGGDLVNVTNLVPVGADAHTFEPTAREMISIAEGDAFIYNGAGLEGFVDAVIETLEDEGVTILQASEGVDFIDFGDEQNDEHEHEEENEHEEHGHDEEENEHAHEERGHEEEDNHDHGLEQDDHQDHNHDEDPHVWLDPIQSIALAENIKNTFIDLMPEQEEFFTTNFEEVKKELEAIDSEFQEMVDAAEKDTFLVSHAGYGYWEERYGLHQIGIAGISPTNEPSQRQLQEIIHLANENGIEYVLFEQNIPAKVADVVKDEVGAEALYLHNLEALVAEDVDNGEDYFSLMRRNIEALGMALQ